MKLLCLVIVAFCVACGRPSSPVCIGGAEFTQGACKSKRVARHHLPFPSGVTAPVTQAFYGGLSHRSFDAFSLDFECQVGDPIVASRDGYVVAVKEDSAVSCSDPSCVDQANYIEIDHGDGTMTEYVHLERFGSLVEEGQSVCRGDLIGLCGSTGFSTGPHLHFSVMDLSRRSIPAQFYEARERSSYGLVAPDSEYLSRNKKQSRCRPTQASRLGKDAFAHQGIILDQRIPMEFKPGDKVSISGSYFGDYSQVAVYRKMLDGRRETIGTCFPVDEDGDFSGSFSWSNEFFENGHATLMLTGADAQCAGPRLGWEWSYKVRLFGSTARIKGEQ